MGSKRKKMKKAMGYLCVTSMLFGSFLLMDTKESKAEALTKTITIDGKKVDTYNRFKGFGTVTANNTSRLLLDYKEENPKAYWEIMNKLFNTKTGAGLTHVKVELGGDVNSSSGTEPATMRYADEPANVLRGAGFEFAADAKSINPDLTTEILRWGEPRWTWNGAAGNEYENRYQWYKQTIDAVYKEYGFRIDYVGISQNERAANNNGKIEVEWLKYFTSQIKKEPNYDSDYKEIKLVAADGYRDTAAISRTLLENPDLIDEIDVISSHYGLTGSNELTQLQNKLISEGKKPKEVWVSEGIAPMINARYREKMEPQYKGLGGKAGIVDVTSRIISAYSWSGAGSNPLRAVSFDLQPAVAAFYEGSSYNPKHLISAYDPWSGFYEADGGLQGVRHVMNFVGYDDHTTPENERWMIVSDATYSDGAFFDGGVDVDTSTHNYMTFKDPQTDDYTTVFANNTKETRKYTIHAANLSGKENAPVYVWETRGAEAGQPYDANWLKQISRITPKAGVYEIEVKPYSIVTLSTLDKKSEVKGFEYQSQPVNLSKDTILPLPYTDDFEYKTYRADDKGRDYVERRGGTPRYTTDQTAAFEVVKKATKPVSGGSAARTDLAVPNAKAHGNMLQQRITPDIIGAEWAVWGGKDGSTAAGNPTTTIGDHRWVNYKASYDFLLDTHTPEAAGRSNYALIGVRQVKAGGADSHAPYNARVYADGRYEILKLGKVVKNGTIPGFNNKIWHNLAFEAKENVFTLYLDGKEIDAYTDADRAVMAGRVSLGSGYYETLIDNLRVEPIKGYTYESDKYDSAQGMKFATEKEALDNKDTLYPIGYLGKWDYTQAGFAHFNRTQMTAKTDVPVWNGVTVGFKDTTKVQGTLNKVFYSGNWSSNSTNTWGAAGTSAETSALTSFEIKFKGTEIRLFGITNASNGTADVYLDGALAGEASYVNNSEIHQEVWSAENLEDREHTLKVVAKDKYISFTKAEIETTGPVTAVTKLAPKEIVSVWDDAQNGTVVNSVYAFRKNGSTWGSNDTNAWAHFNDDPYLLIHFTGTGIDYLAGTGVKSQYNFELDGTDAGNYSVNPDGVMYSVRGLEEKTHTLKVALQTNERKEDYMDYRGVQIYSTSKADPANSSSMIFDFKGSGFNLFGATPDALLDVYIDGILIDENFRIRAAGDRQTSYSIRGLSNAKHTAKAVVKGGTFVFDGMDIIRGTNKVEVNKDKLQALYDASQGKDPKNYTKKSWKAFHSALQEAKAVLKNPQAPLEKVAAAAASLQAALQGLTAAQGTE
ncbi:MULTISPECIES: S-layer protein [Paenibacillus]|uniref:S-layer protein n=1 Tax=Paenibacillus TaxID=44249 RepID=UPI0022B91789|nr:S-layer protein [Paenibacillus caseinilyticus]MCZ8519415.1 S-layer protein [Paenibacillus caseinilyticus]